MYITSVAAYMYIQECVPSFDICSTGCLLVRSIIQHLLRHLPKYVGPFHLQLLRDKEKDSGEKTNLQLR